MKRILVLGLLVGAFAVAPSAAPASCAASEIGTANRLVTPGDEIEIAGEGWTDGCNDTEPSGCDTEPEAEPYEDVLMMLKKPGLERFYELERVDATEEGILHLSAEVPDLLPGRYRLVAQVGTGYRVLADGFVTVEK